MNKRIKELADAALIPFKDENSFECHHFSKELFAELIVRECIDTVLDCSIEYTTRPRIAQELKEHFGVEE